MSFFEFKQFRVNQDQTAMKVCTDACLFGTIIKPEKATAILDIGTGTGLLALMLAQRCDVRIDAVEIDINSAEQAKENFDNSRWKERLKVFQTSIQDFSVQYPEKYDLIMANPPFFENHLKRSTIAENIALHSEKLSLTELLDCTLKLLHPSGSFWVLLPPYQSNQLENLASEQNLFLNEQYQIFTKENGKIIRHISRFSFHQPKIETHQIAIKNQKNEYTEIFKSLLKDYYLYL